jgi:hypothetical protein
MGVDRGAELMSPMSCAEAEPARAECEPESQVGVTTTPLPHLANERHVGRCFYFFAATAPRHLPYNSSR